MPVPPLLPSLPPVTSAGRFLRVEYLGFENVGEHREFRFRVFSPEGPTDFRLRIASAAFGAHRVGMQDGPDVCYQRLLRVVAAGDMASQDVITIDDADLASYREAHTRVPKTRSSPAAQRPRPTVTRPEPRPRAPERAPAPPVAKPVEPAFEEGQRVSHALFGVGVTSSSNTGHTVVHFDKDGPKTFVTSLLEMDVLSAPHTWETVRGDNRPRRPAVVKRPTATS
jgi:hypothetical protein